MASAGTIIDENTTQSNPVTNVDTATESVCPKGWTLPDNVQIQSMGDRVNTYVSSFKPTIGGRYAGGTLKDDTTHGCWWGSEAKNGAIRYDLAYNDSGPYLYAGSHGRYAGLYIRCVQAP
ncbi:hypothetical protein IJG27_00870 [Candidatus Saccharibacteria bacterium]|nr:hypothetical protein [Candidatus Saccharibacteria bacterium]